MPPFSPRMPGIKRLIMIPGIILLQVVPPSVDTDTPARPALGSVWITPPTVTRAPPKHMALSFAIATDGALERQSNGSPLPPGVRSTLIMFLSANVFPASLEIETWHSAMRSSLSAFVSIGKLYCRQATATRLGFDRLTATWGNTEANFGVFLLMLV